MKVCFIGACGHWEQAYQYLKTRNDITFCGFAPGCPEENQIDSIDNTITYFADYRTMLDKVKPELAIISPIFALTGQIIIECANRGIDVFSEKPIASSFEELNQVESAVSKNGIKFCAMHSLRFEPAFFFAAEMVKEGKLGKLQMITAQKSYKYGTRPDWYSVPNLYGGTILWVGIHAIDWIAHFSGKRFVSVMAQSVGNCPEMAALCQFKLDDNVIASVNIDYYRPETATTHGDDRIRCVGTKGVLEVCGGKVLLVSQDGVVEYHPNSSPNLLAEFLADNILISKEELFYITKVAIAANESAKTEKIIMIGD